MQENIGPILLSGLGILRSGETIRRSLAELEALPETSRTLLGRAMLKSALAREESRGAHTRTDFPERDDGRFRKTTIAAYRDGELHILFRDIPERRPEDAH